MIALRYFCGFSLQIFPYAFFCLYPFRDRFRLSTKKTMLMALSIFIVMVIPFSLIAQFNIGGDYRELHLHLINQKSAGSLPVYREQKGFLLDGTRLSI